MHILNKTCTVEKTENEYSQALIYKWLSFKRL